MKEFNLFTTFNHDPMFRDALLDYIGRKLEPFGYNKYAYTVLSKQNRSKIMIISTYPEEWVTLYQENKFQYIDPVIMTALTRTSPFSWDDNITLMTDLRFKKIFTIAKKFGIMNGQTLVLHDQLDNLAMLSLSPVDNKNKREINITAERSLLQMQLIDIHEHMLNIFFNTTRQSGKEKNTAFNNIFFTSRENEVLYWSSMGKTYDEIASITGITSRTVKYHMAKVVNKLGCSNARQAIRMGVEMKLIRSVH